MQNIFFQLSLPDLGLLIPSFLFWGMGTATIIIDLGKRRREHIKGQQRPWYQRIMMLIGTMLILIGLMVLPFTSIISSMPWWLSSTLSTVFLCIIVAFGIYAFFILIRRTLILSTSPQAIFVGHRDPDHESFPANPFLLTTYMILGVGLLLLTILSLLGIFQLHSFADQHQLFFWVGELLAGIPFLVFFLMRMNVRLHTLQRIERLRFLHTIKRSDVIASVRPNSTSSVPFAPLSITLRIKRTYIGVFIVFITGLIVPSATRLVVQFTQQEQDTSLIFWLAFGLALLILCFIPLFILRTTIEAKENGLRTEAGKFLHWHEARLFACYTLPDILPGRGTVTIYELSSSSSVIIWRWIHNPQSPRSAWKPQLPFDTYHQQLQTLYELVTEKTGLPLYNLTQLLEEEPDAK